MNCVGVGISHMEMELRGAGHRSLVAGPWERMLPGHEWLRAQGMLSLYKCHRRTSHLGVNLRMF